ncbi:MAG: protein kinase [Candidatus Lustribacter sp.]|jgi:serine/threonine-protein kinase
MEKKVLGGRYRIDALIGRGGMSDVYRGMDVVLQRQVAIKILTDRSEDLRKRFLREAQSMARLNHTNIVGVYDAAQNDGVSYIVMELVQGRTLATISPSELTVHTALRYILELLEALAFAHENNVVHRDVKPANIMVLPNGAIKVMDFGLSRRTSEMSSVTNAGEIVGTIAYLSPERFLGKIADARSDLYSVGVVMYEVFTGTVPFKNESDDLVAVIFAHVNEPPAALRSINPAVPAPIERIVLRLLEKDPERRYASAREVIVDIRTLLGLNEPGEQAPSSAVGMAAAMQGRSAPTGGTSPAEVEARNVLERTFGNTQTLNEGYANTLAGMLAARKRDWPEATRAYVSALKAFSEVRNHVEHAKTALKYATMVLAKGAESERPDRHEVENAIETLGRALLVLRARNLTAEVDDGERVLHALQRMGVRLR